MFVDGKLSCWVIERSRDLEVFSLPSFGTKMLGAVTLQ